MLAHRAYFRYRRSRRVVLVLYYTRGVYPLRGAIESHLYAWRRYSRHVLLYVNVAFGFPEWLLRMAAPDVVVFHTLFLGMRWTPSIFDEYSEKCRSLRDFDCVKIAMPQDDFLHSDIVTRFVREFAVTHLFTAARAGDARHIYAGVDFDRVTLHHVLTGFVDSRIVNRLSRSAAQVGAAARPIDVGYRAWRAEYWLGEHGLKKFRIAQAVENVASASGLQTDISLRPEDTLVGDAWLRFLSRCKATIGCEGGASLLDRDGSIRTRTLEYLARHPDAGFEQVRDECFPRHDGAIGLFVITPRHFEACATRTLQILVEGRYDDILRPHLHYVPVKADLSDVAEALQTLKDPVAIDRITQRAYDDVIGSGRWTYQQFVQGIDSSVIDRSPRGDISLAMRVKTLLAWAYLGIVDRIDWVFIRFERWIIDRQMKPTFLARTYVVMKRWRWGDF